MFNIYIDPPLTHVIGRRPSSPTAPRVRGYTHTHVRTDAQFHCRIHMPKHTQRKKTACVFNIPAPLSPHSPHPIISPASRNNKHTYTCSHTNSILRHRDCTESPRIKHVSLTEKSSKFIEINGGVGCATRAHTHAHTHARADIFVGGCVCILLHWRLSLGAGTGMYPAVRLSCYMWVITQYWRRRDRFGFYKYILSQKEHAK